MDDISHYPPADFEPAISDLAEFLWPGGKSEPFAANHSMNDPPPTFPKNITIIDSPAQTH